MFPPLALLEYATMGRLKGEEMSIRNTILLKAAAAAAPCYCGDGYMRAASAAGFELREQTAEAVAVSSAGATAVPAILPPPNVTELYSYNLW